MSTPQSHSQNAGCLNQGVILAALLFGLFVPLFIQTGALQAAWADDLSKMPYTPKMALTVSILHPIAMLILLAGFLFPPRVRLRAVLTTLLVASGCAALLMIPRLMLPFDSVYLAAAARVVITLLVALPLLILAIRRGARAGLGTIPAALLVAAPFALAWVRLGALGNWLDSVVAIAQALALGALAAGLLGGILMPALQRESAGRGWDLALATGTLLVAMFGVGGAFGQDDYQALMMPVLLAAAIPAAALALPDRDGQIGLFGPFLAMSLIACLPLAFADPEELSLVVALSNDTYAYTQSAAFWAVLVGLIAWVIFQVTIRWLPRLGPSAIIALLAVLLWGGIGAAYATSSQTGQYGNYAFVILKDQADLAQAAQIGDVTERRRFVYKTLVDKADTTQAGLRRLLDSRGIRYTPFYLMNAIEVEGDALLYDELGRRPEVDRVILSQNLRALPVVIEPEPGDESEPLGPPWGIVEIGADRVWNELNVRGKGVVIGQSDSGVDWQHPAIRDAYRGRDGFHDYNWLDPWAGKSEPWDGNGHGTHTIGTVLGAGGIGVAPEATWFGCSNLERNIGNPPDYLRCMQFMLAPYPIKGNALRDGDPARAADVSTNSWGCPPIEGCDDAALLPAVQALRAAGIFFVAAAGNEGSVCDSLRTPPGNYASAFSVGAIGYDGELTSFSSRGPNTNSPDGRNSPTILAPGEGVLSAWPGGGYHSTSGTSMAAPHVAGVVALMWSANPALRGNIDATEQILIETARPYEGSYTGCGDAQALPNPESGYGIVDAYAAVERALQFER